jgi:hypothetical protein
VSLILGGLWEKAVFLISKELIFRALLIILAPAKVHLLLVGVV